jgi:transposase
MAVVVIGVDPHKASHTAVAVNAAEEPLGQLRVRASAVQAERLLEWAQAWPERAWAVEGAGGLGHLLDWQLLSAGERVLDVPPELAARVRLLATGTSRTTIPAMPARRRSPHCAPPMSGKPGVMITPRCSRSGPSATGTWAGPAPR